MLYVTVDFKIGRLSGWLSPNYMSLQMQRFVQQQKRKAEAREFKAWEGFNLPPLPMKKEGDIGRD